MWHAHRFAGSASLLFSGGVFAAVPEFPNKPIRYISAASAGGASDLIARTVGAAMSDVLGVQVVVDNRPGRGQHDGAELASRAAPDGYTISDAISPRSPCACALQKLGYDPDRDFVPLGMVASNPNVLTINPSIRAATIPEFVSVAKAQPGKFELRVCGCRELTAAFDGALQDAGWHRHRACALQRRGAATVDLMAGRVQAMFSTVPSVLSAVPVAKCVRSASRRCSAIPICRTSPRSPNPDAGFRSHVVAGRMHAIRSAGGGACEASRYARHGARSAGNAQAARGPRLSAPHHACGASPPRSFARSGRNGRSS